MLNEKIIKPVAMGQYIIVNKKNAGTNLIIATPAVQSCIALVLMSDQAVGLAHFDTDVDLDSALNKMITEIKNCGENEIKAQLIGGTYGLTPYRP